jgi:hypothetical protein
LNDYIIIPDPKEVLWIGGQGNQLAIINNISFHPQLGKGQGNFV